MKRGTKKATFGVLRMKRRAVVEQTPQACQEVSGSQVLDRVESR